MITKDIIYRKAFEEKSAELKKKLESAKQVVVTKIGEEEIPF